ncbi:MAG: hypothetical protein CL606_08330 [Anaerolineaceae bacterium]|nr:hypothetical protein [Anaerolineaceae bacterium]|tara:strand:- start:7396 stop:8187 length:792 start_codon:yes stop_codon:yes gene_type:complete
MYDLLLPGSLPFLLILILIGVVLLYTGPKLRAAKRIWLTSTLCTYWLMSTHLGATYLESLLNRDVTSITANIETIDADAIVVLSGGGHTLGNNANTINIASTHTAYRVLEAYRLHKKLPEVPIILSGGIGDSLALSISESEIMRKELLELGVQDNLLLMEQNSNNTYEQAINIAMLMTRLDMRSFILVTSHTHMKRALATFQTQDLYAIPSAAFHTTTPALRIKWSLFPNKTDLDRSQNVVREIAAYLYYKQQGWIAIADDFD